MKNNTITTITSLGEKTTFEVVNIIPADFFVWNIGDNMGHDEYIPLAHYGVTCKKTALAVVKRNAKSVYQKRKKALAQDALDIFERISA